MAKQTWRLYPDRKRVGQSFKGVKDRCVPDQSMSLAEILRRFIRREELPVEKQGSYVDVGIDLEKIANADITEQMEVVDDIKSDLKKKEAHDKRLQKEAKEAKEKAEKDAASAAQAAQSGPKGQQNDPLDKK